MNHVLMERGMLTGFTWDTGTEGVAQACPTDGLAASRLSPACVSPFSSRISGAERRTMVTD